MKQFRPHIKIKVCSIAEVTSSLKGENFVLEKLTIKKTHKKKCESR